MDPFFDPTQTMGVSMCHACGFSEKLFGNDAHCPHTFPDSSSADGQLVGQGYAFGRYACNPPQRLIKSLFHHMQAMEPNPPFIVFTGDIAPHGYPGDRVTVTSNSVFSDFCSTKLDIMRQATKYFVSQYPNTPYMFTMGNNDHLPKNTYWQPWIKALGDMFLEEGFIDSKQHADFVKFGSHYKDVDGVRFIMPDLTLFAPGGETSFVKPSTYEKVSDVQKKLALMYPVRERTIRWFGETLAEARKLGLSVYIVGHQPLTTKKGKDELDVEGLHYGRLKDYLSQYADIIKMGFFGHRNLAGLQEIMSPWGTAIIPSLTGPGVSPRGKNQPSFNTMYMDPKTKTILEFEQWTFNLMDENQRALNTDLSYLGQWRQTRGDMYSWRQLSGQMNFTADTLAVTLDHVPRNSKQFFAIEVWKRAGYIGDETPEDYWCKSMHDTNEDMMQCLFPNQDIKCWDMGWLS